MSSSFQDAACSEYIDEIKKLHSSNNQLKKANNELIQELGIIRDQLRLEIEKNQNFERQNNENDKTQNIKLEEKIRDLEKEKNEISDQLKLAKETIDNYNENQIQEKEILKPIPRHLNDPKDFPENNIFQKNNQNMYDLNLQDINNEYQSQITELNENNEKLARNLNALVKKNEQYKQNNKILIETFSNYFQKKFQNINQIINYVKKEKKNSKNTKVDSEKQVKPKKTNQKNTESSNNCNQKMEAEKLNLEIELKKIENDVIKFKHETELKEIKYKQDMEDKDKKISSFENENNFLKQQIIGMNSALNSLPMPFQFPNSMDQDNKLSVLQQTLFETSKQLQSSQNENKDINRQLSNIKADNDELFNKIENKNQEIINLRIERDDYESKYNATFAQIEVEKANNKKITTSLTEISKKYQLSQDSIRKFEKLFESQKEEILKLTSDRNSLSTLIFKIKDFVQKEEDIYQKLISENKSYKKNLKSIKNTINSIKNKSAPDAQQSNPIPITSWYSIDFEEDLCKMISEIASNEGINDTAKLKYVFQTIAKYYKRKINDLKDENQKELDKHASQTSSTTDFILSVAKQIGVKDADSDFISNPMKICDFQQNLTSLINECENLRKSYEYHTNLLNLISVKLNTTYEEIPEKIECICKHVDDLQNDMSSSLSKHKSEKQEYKKKLEHLNSKNAKSNKQKDAIIAKLKSQNARLVDQVKILNNAVKEYKNKKPQPDKPKSITEVEEEKIDSNQVTIVSSSSSTSITPEYPPQSSLVELNSQINEIKDMISNKDLIQNKDKEIKRLEDEVFFWKQNLEAFKALQQKKESDYQKNKDNNEELLMEARKRFQSEKDEISKQYELVISNIKKQNLELKNIIETMTASISKNETKISQLKQKNSQLSTEKEGLANQLKSQKEELNRQLSINSQKLRACKIVNESSSKNAMADLRLQFYSEKRKIFSFAIHLFHSFYDNDKKIDENVYKETLTKANDLLQKLTKQDRAIRELLGITNNESIETNISSVLMKLYHQT